MDSILFDKISDMILSYLDRHYNIDGANFIDKDNRGVFGCVITRELVNVFGVERAKAIALLLRWAKTKDMADVDFYLAYKIQPDSWVSEYLNKKQDVYFQKINIDLKYLNER